MWVAGVLGFGIIAAGAWLFRLGMKHATAFPHVEPQKTLSRPPVNSPAITRPPTIDKPQSKARRPHPEPTGNGELSIDSPDDYTINIRRFANAGAKGLAMNLDKLPSATDHKMLGYLNALARPPIDNSVAPFNPNHDLYRQLDLK
jgi:hypothetical protein